MLCRKEKRNGNLRLRYSGGGLHEGGSLNGWKLPIGVCETAMLIVIILNNNLKMLYDYILYRRRVTWTMTKTPAATLLLTLSSQPSTAGQFTSFTCELT
jgi:hypothetical protein